MWLSFVIAYAMYQTLQAALRIQKALALKQHVAKAAHQDLLAWLLLWCAYVVYTVVWETFLWIIYSRSNMLFSLLETMGMFALVIHRHDLREVLLAHETEIEALPALWQKHALTLFAQALIIARRVHAQVIKAEPSSSPIQTS